MPANVINLQREKLLALPTEHLLIHLEDRMQAKLEEQRELFDAAKTREEREDAQRWIDWLYVEMNYLVPNEHKRQYSKTKFII